MQLLTKFMFIKIGGTLINTLNITTVKVYPESPYVKKPYIEIKMQNEWFYKKYYFETADEMKNILDYLEFAT